MPYKSEHKGEWKIGMFYTCCEEPCYFLGACFCPCCTAYSHRQKLIQTVGDGKYYCCAGMYPCCCLKNECPEACLCIESCCFLSCAVIGNRKMIQESQQLRNTCCDECILWTTCLVSWALCILRIVGVHIHESVQNCVDCMYYTVLGCMQTQHAIQMGWVGSAVPVAKGAPATQAMNYGATPGIAPPAYQTQQQAYAQPGYPPQGYPQQQVVYPQQGGYPPQQAPPQQYPQQAYAQQGYPQQRY